jgi:membrane protease YdiL (CAAX protease family)
MKLKSFALALLLFVLGAAGILSTLSMEIPIPPEAKAMLSASFTDEQIKWVLLINPAIMLLIAVLAGSLLYRKAHFQIPFLEKLFGIENKHIDSRGIIKSAGIGGIAAGILLSTTGMLFLPLLPEEFTTLSSSIKTTFQARFLYGGITEELLMRFGLMTFLVWLSAQITGSYKASNYWIGVAISSLLFAAGHLPIVFQSVANPSAGLISYVLIGNSIGGLIFGWLYWKKGLESAMIAHILAHVVMVIAEYTLV